MLYKKYAIEVVYSTPVIMNTEILPNTMFNGVSLVVNNISKLVNIVQYLNEIGILLDTPTTFYTYKNALQTLERFYYYVKGNHTYNIKTFKVVEIYDDIIPPIEVMRSLKIKKIKEKIK